MRLVSFDLRACRRFAAFALEHPPPEHVVRAEPQGLLVARFVLPLECCPTLNAFAEMPTWKRLKLKKQALLLMRVQHDHRLPMVPGRPWVRAIRFSSVEPDRDAAWTKIALDRCTGKHGGLGLIQDDKPSRLDMHFWWERAPKGAGFCLFDVFTGKATT